ncbi:MAG TPA: TadE family type IV pilus minor pilin [Nocardioidaceae bacterium]|nr:TadE family type IV pilus minor pilin [Nocardioidaceae bacterium]
MGAPPATSNRRGGHGRHGRTDRGTVTAETAMVLPVLVAVVLGLVWLVSLGVTQVRVVDAARETARAVARDEPRAGAVELGRRVAPDGAEIRVDEGGEIVRVVVTADVRGPGGLFGFLPTVQVDADAIAAEEPS